MNRRLSGAILLVAAVACGPAARSKGPPTTASTRTAAQGARGTTNDPIHADLLDAIASRYRAACKSPGAAVGVRTSDGTERFAVSGELAPGVTLDRDSQFLAGSVTKLFVAAVAYQLIEARNLSLDDTVDSYLPGWPAGDRITIAMLIAHRSGMGDFGNDFSTQLKELVLADLTRVYRYDEVLELIRPIPRVAEPGQTYHYTNANYIVLGAILQQITNRTLGQLIHARLIEPLGLRRTLYGPDDLAAATAVTFHGLFDVAGTGSPVDIGDFPRNAALTVDPAGAGLFSTIPDLLTATHALFATDTVLAPRFRAALGDSVSTVTADDLGLDDSYAIHGHGGASPGAQTIVAYDATHDTTVAVWCNRLDPGEYELFPSVAAANELIELANDR